MSTATLTRPAMPKETKSDAIPVRLDQDVYDVVDRISRFSGVSKPEIVRRCIDRCLAEAQKQGNFDFLLEELSWDNVLKDLPKKNRPNIDLEI